MAQRRADDDQRMDGRRSLDEFDERCVDGVEQRLLLQEIVDRVRGHSKLGKQHERGAVLVSVSRQFDRPRNVESRIGDSHGRRRDGDSDEAMRVQTIERMGHEVRPGGRRFDWSACPP